ncbi:class I SAM-dependent methyltransferase [Nitratidesulfovibrio liaohensis]|uniref:class I SAM-dependent methyltransferase n=1 Tax=Nitratidesulfovibrio liaohensis TaxID=2604158 RepID=UPI0014228270|nr:class I SAM-dependent methyltransferase [Nitratidesulfovibrio liaohensis]NHZ47780.1 methyltransferase domain-containing protein [Nitratidesulfovibrio liaohensis]
MAADPYARIAEWYDLLLNPVLDGVRRAVADVCRAEGLLRVLDACCGTGRQCALLRGAGVACVGTDLSPAMLGAARSATRVARPCERDAVSRVGAPLRQRADGGGEAPPAAGLPQLSCRVPLLRADACMLPFADNAFDAVVLSLALHEMPEPAANAALAEALRVAPRVLLADYRLAERNLDLPAALFVHLPERLAGAEHYRNFRGFMARGGVEGLAHRAGLAVIRRERLFGGAGALLLAERNSRAG